MPRPHLFDDSVELFPGRLAIRVEVENELRVERLVRVDSRRQSVVGQGSQEGREGSQLLRRREDKLWTVCVHGPVDGLWSTRRRRGVRHGHEILVRERTAVAVYARPGGEGGIGDEKNVA